MSRRRKTPLGDAVFFRQAAKWFERAADRIEAHYPVCLICLERFMPETKAQVYCNSRCRREAKRRRTELQAARTP